MRSSSQPMKYQTNKAEIDRNEIIQIEKEAARHADYTGIEKPPSVTNNGRSMKFNQLVSFFDNISTEKDTLKRSRKLEKLFDYHRKQFGNDFYNLLRLMIPERERERSMFGIKEAVLAKIYVELLALSKDHKDGHRLLSWKAPTAGNFVSGDFASVLVDVMKNRVSYERKSEFTIDEVNDKLDQLSRAKNFIQKKDIMKEFARNCDTTEQFWLVRILLKNLKISIRERSILSHFHRDAYSLFEVTTDLRTVAYKLYDPSIRLHDNDSSVQLFQVFQPMLCKRNVIPQIIKKMPKSVPFVVEEKMDGERIQLHKKGTKYKYWSRNAKDYTYLYGENPKEGSFTPHIHHSFDDRVDEIVLDGEMLAYSAAVDTILPFGTLKKAAKGDINIHPESHVLELTIISVIVFDVLWVNGKDISKYPFKERQKVGKTVFNPISTRIEHVSRWEATQADELKQSLERIIISKGEGLVVKSPLSLYAYGGRSDQWIKVGMFEFSFFFFLIPCAKLKPDYFDEMSETADLLVIGGNWSASRNGTISTLYCALVDDRHEKDEPDFLTFTRVGTGYTAMDLELINQHFRKSETRKYTPASVYPGIEIGNETPDIIIDPKELTFSVSSFVVEIKASDINRSVQVNYPCGYTYRFPRFKRLRLDKGNGRENPVDPDNIFKYSDMIAMRDGIQSSRRKQTEDKIREKKRAQPTKKKKQVISSRAVANVRAEKDNVRSNLFEGCAFRILNGTNDLEVSDLAVLVSERKGMILSKIPNDEDCPEPLLVVAGKPTAVQVTQLMKTQKRSILSANWLLDCVKHNCIIPLEGKDGESQWVFECATDRDTILNTLRPFFVTPEDRNLPGVSQGQIDEDAVGEINELKFAEEPTLHSEADSAQDKDFDSDSATENERNESDNDIDIDDTIQEETAEEMANTKADLSSPLQQTQPEYKQTSTTRTATRRKANKTDEFDSSDESDDNKSIPTATQKQASPEHVKESQKISTPTFIKQEVKEENVDENATSHNEKNLATSSPTTKRQLHETRVVSKDEKRRSHDNAFDSGADSDAHHEDGPVKKVKHKAEPHELKGQDAEVESIKHYEKSSQEQSQDLDNTHTSVPIAEVSIEGSDNPEKPLLNVVVYIDDYENAIENDLFPRPSITTEIDWSVVKDRITNLGGKIGELDDDMLTHIVIDSRDKARVEELFDRTKQ
ncbi:ATP-dependent DNA ligase [Wallemia mellicola]|nr:ATP-dependent DNA ligase [Wallemia mellicola]